MEPKQPPQVEMIVEQGPRGQVTYSGFVVGETEQKVALVPYMAAGKRLPPAVTISKSRIVERVRLVPQRKRETASAAA